MMTFRKINTKILVSLIVFGTLVFQSFNEFALKGNSNTSFILSEDSISTINLVFAGDIMQHKAQLEAAYDTASKGYVYDTYYKYITPIVSKADFAIANLETTLGGAPYSGYPQFCSPDIYAEELKKAGFDLLITANNHSLDRGKKGIERTIDIIDSLKLLHTGTFKDSISRATLYPLIFEVKKIKLALLNCTYATNGLKVTAPNIVNYIDTAEIRRDIKKAKDANPDMMIMTIHWGNEYQRQPNQTQINLAKFIFDEGVDLIIGSHPHVIQPFGEIQLERNGKKKKGVVFYSLGNFVSNMSPRFTDGGIISQVQLIKNYKTNITEISSYGYIPAWVYKNNESKKTKYYVLPAQFENDSDSFNFTKSDLDKKNIFFHDTRDLLGKENANMLETK